MNRRMFIGKILGTFAATSMPWIGEEALAEPTIRGLVPAIQLPDRTLIKAPPISDLIYNTKRGTFELRLAEIKWDKIPQWADMLMSSIRFVTDGKTVYGARVAAIGRSSGGAYGIVVNLPKSIKQNRPDFMQKLDETEIPHRYER